MSTRAQQFVDAIIARLRTIATADGYATDAGENVVQGPADFDQASVRATGGLRVQAISENYAAPGVDRVVLNTGRGAYAVTQAIEIAGAMPITADQTKGTQLEILLGDVKRALGSDVHFLDSDGRPMGSIYLASCDKAARQDGQEFEGFLLTIEADHAERRGAPDQR